MSAVRITSSNYAGLVMASEKPVLLDFWASWCGPCRMVSPVVDEIAAERDDLLVGKVNVDEEPELASAFNISSIPTLVVLKDGKVVNRATGARPKSSILSLVTLYYSLPSKSKPAVQKKMACAQAPPSFYVLAFPRIIFKKWASSLQKVPAQPRTARLTTPAMYYIIFIL